MVAVNELGPLQWYAAPATVGVCSVSVLPVHTGELLVMVGKPGIALTTTTAVSGREVQPLTVTVKI